MTEVASGRGGEAGVRKPVLELPGRRRREQRAPATLRPRPELGEESGTGGKSGGLRRDRGGQPGTEPLP
jgi:hypothetical protein